MEATTQVHEGLASPKTFDGYFPKLQEPRPQPNLSSYYKFLEGGKVIPHKLEILTSLNLKKKEEGHIDGCNFLSKRK